MAVKMGEINTTSIILNDFAPPQNGISAHCNALRCMPFHWYNVHFLVLWNKDKNRDRVNMISSANIIERDVFRLLSFATLFDRCKWNFHYEILWTLKRFTYMCFGVCTVYGSTVGWWFFFLLLLQLFHCDGDHST